MSILSGIRNFLFKPKALQRGYREVISLGGTNTDWPIAANSQDADVWQNNYALRQRLRDLFDTTPFFRKYKEQLLANVFGDEGIRLRMKVKEQEDRTIYVEEEKSAIQRHVERMDAIADYVAAKTGKPRTRDLIRNRFGARFYAAADPMGRAKGTIKAGALDTYANQLIEKKWKEWQLADYATVTGKLTYSETRHLRILAAARDGDFFIRLVRDPKINKFGFALQLIHSEWCDFNYNVPKKGDSNEIRMGVEMDSYGKPVAYHFIKRSAADWMYSSGGAMGGAVEHQRIPAEEIIHYARYDYSDSTRPAPWCVAAIPNARNLTKYIEAAVTAARAGACQMGFLYSDVNPEGGGLDPSMVPDPCAAANSVSMAPGTIVGLAHGVKYQANNPNNPNSQFHMFRKEMVRDLAAAVPGGNYNFLGNDAEGISYSTARAFSIDDRELWKLLQRFDIDKAERPIFSAWLEMALITGQIPLPLRKFEKFNQPVFSGRRWSWIDPAKDAKALECELENMLTSWSRVMDNRGDDLEEVWIERAEEKMLAESLDLTLPTFGAVPMPAPAEETDDNEEPTPPPANGKKNGRHVSLVVN